MEMFNATKVTGSQSMKSRNRAPPHHEVHKSHRKLGIRKNAERLIPKGNWETKCCRDLQLDGKRRDRMLALSDLDLHDLNYSVTNVVTHRNVALPDSRVLPLHLQPHCVLVSKIQSTKSLAPVSVRVVRPSAVRVPRKLCSPWNH